MTQTKNNDMTAGQVAPQATVEPLTDEATAFAMKVASEYERDGQTHTSCSNAAIVLRHEVLRLRALLATPPTSKAAPTVISRELLGKIVDEAFGGACEDTSPIEDIYRIIVAEFSMPTSEATEPQSDHDADQIMAILRETDDEALLAFSAREMRGVLNLLSAERFMRKTVQERFDALRLATSKADTGEVPSDTFDRLYVGKATAGDQLLAYNALCHDRLIGMAVSIDVSTGDDDSTNRIFGRVAEVMLKSGGSDEDTILAIEDSRNFTSNIDRELLEDAQIVFGQLGGNRIGGGYRAQWEKCRDLLNSATPSTIKEYPTGEQL